MARRRPLRARWRCAAALSRRVDPDVPACLPQPASGFENDPQHLPMTDRPTIPEEPPPPPLGQGADRILRIALRVGVVTFFVLALLVLAVRELLLPRADAYRDEVAGMISRSVGLPVRIERLEAEWPGARLSLQLHGLVVGDAAADEALRLERVEASLGWSSLLLGRPHFHRLVLVAPRLAVVREADARIRVAGLGVGEAGAGGDFAAWLLSQGEIAIVDAAISWHDRLRGAPVLHLDAFDLRVERIAGRYRFGLRGRPGAGIASLLELRGDLVSDRPTDASRWHGQVFARVADARLEGMAPWVDYPLPLSGQGQVEAWVDVDDGQPRSAKVDFALHDFAARFDAALPAFALREASGRLEAAVRAGEHSIGLRGVALVTSDGLHVPATDVDLMLRGGRRPLEAGSLRASRADLGVLGQLTAYLPIPDGLRERLALHRPRGLLQDVLLEWHSPLGRTRLARIDARFSDLALAPGDGLPGAEGLTGEVRGDGDAGRFALRGREVILDLPQIFPESRMGFARIDADGGWGHTQAGLEIRLERASFENPDAAGEAQGVLRPAASRLGDIDFTARLTRAAGDAVWRYLPHSVNATTRTWLQRAIVGATVHDTRLTLRGALEDFPFTEGAGQFLVTVDLRDGRLEYAEDWPAIEGIVASLRFEGAGMHIAASDGRILGARLSEVTADIPDLDDAKGQVLTVRGRAEGATADFLRFVSQSPVRNRVDGFTDGMTADGDGVLELAFVMPLEDVDATEVDGSYRFSRNRIRVVDWLPPLEQAEGMVRFSADRFAIEQGAARAFGEPLRITARTVAPGDVRFDVAGGISVRALRQLHGWPWLSHLSGSAPWRATIAVGAGGTRADVRSTLAGISSSLPAPLNKRAADPWPLRVELGFTGATRDLRGSVEDRIEFAFAAREAREGLEIQRGGVAFGAPLWLPAKGVGVSARLAELDVDAWRGVLSGEGETGSVPVTALHMDIDRVRAFGYDIAHLDLEAEAAEHGWNGRVSSDLLAGAFAWRGEGEGTLALRLEHLLLGQREASDAEVARLLEMEDSTTLPDMDVVAERFELRGIDLGRLALQARNEGGAWLLDSVSIANPDAQLTGSGRWQPGRVPLTRLTMRFESGDIGRFLARMGYPEAVRNGSAVLGGELEWRGIPTRIDYPSLNGAFRVDARNGRFSKLEPGVGRLLGVLSLQALPRRLKLDFSDVFSEGFAFDSLGGNVGLRSGVLGSEDFEISGPAARIWIAGSASLPDETQDIKVVVQPTLSESVAVGAAAGLINPVAGVVAYLAQKVLSDPIERMFAYGYAITGTWADPQVEKLPVGQGRSAAQQEQRSE